MTRSSHGVERYYTAKLGDHGPSARGVDWNSRRVAGAALRPAARGRARRPDPFSLNDYGCGYGALADIWPGTAMTSPTGASTSPRPMIAEARERLGAASAAASSTSDDRAGTGRLHGRERHLQRAARQPGRASGAGYAEDTIARMAELSTRGFAFNMLTSYSDAERMRDDLYYGDPCAYFDHCKRYYSRHVALLHDYGLYEFTIVVRLEEDA